jgi:folate-dependent phosphoribosylglycinamide formyltransferase PurN
MKLLILDQNKQPQMKNSFLGGIERFSRVQVRLLSKHHEVAFGTHADSEELEEGYRQLFLSSEKKIFSQEIEREISENRPDIIFCHHHSPSFLSELKGYGIPVVYFCHVLWGTAGIIGLSRWETILRAIESPDIFLAAVSNTQREYYCNWRKSEDVFDFTLSNYIFSDPSFVPDSNGKGIIIARMDPAKRIESGLKYFKKHGIPVQLFTSEAIQEYKEYEEKILKLTSEMNVEVFVNRPYSEVMTALGQSKYNFVSHPLESGSLVGFEAMERGVPSIFNNGRNGGPHVVSEIYNQGGAVSHLFPPPEMSREKIRGLCRSTYSVENWLEKYEQLIDTLLKRTYKVERTRKCKIF